MRRPLVLVAVPLLAAACGGSKPQAAAPTTAASAPTATATATVEKKVAIDPADVGACASLYARLQRVSAAISTGSELLTQVQNKDDLSRQILIQQQQLERSAALMDSAVVPKPLTAANHQLVSALHTFARDFAKAKAPAKRGDFQAASSAMSDPDAIARIVDSTKTIQTACKP
jgi:hypothetical protein